MGRGVRLGWIMRAGRVLPIVCAVLLGVCASAGADEVAPSIAVAPVAAPAVQPPVATPTVVPAAQPTPAPSRMAVPEATAAAQPTPAPLPMAVADATTAAQPTPAPSPMAVPEATAAGQATPALSPMTASQAAAAAPATSEPTVVGVAARAAVAGAQATAARTRKVAGTAQATPPPTPGAPSGCATPDEFSARGECEVPAAVCSIPLGTDGDDVLTGTPFDDILCGFGGDDQLHGGDGSDMLLGGEGDDILVGGEGDDCIVGGPGTDSADLQIAFDKVDVERAERTEHFHRPSISIDAEGRCRAQYLPLVPGFIPRTTPPKIVGVRSATARVQAPAPGSPTGGGVASSSSAGGLRLAVSGGARAVRRGVVRVRVSCSASASAELVLLAGSRRIAHKRFVCRPPGRAVRVRLNDAGRRLLARHGRVRARVLVLAAGRTFSARVLLVSPGG
jgi:RTX calcium-binding nonapeptide repeat (4 copies)